MKIPEYAPPPGYYDRPYTYVFYPNDMISSNPTGAIGQNFGVAKRVALNKDFYVLRQIKFVNMICGLPNLGTAVGDYGTGFRFKDALGRDTASALRPAFGGQAVSGLGVDTRSLYVATWPVVPEIPYPRNSSIVFDVNGLTLGYNGAGAGQTVFSAPYYLSGGVQAVSQIHFVGVKRMKGADPVPRDTQGRIPEDYSYVQTITVATPAAGSSVPDVKQYFQTITGWNFELTDISIAGDINATAAPGGSVRIKVFDSQKIPCSDSWLSGQGFNQLQQGTSATAQTGTPQGMGALVPTLWYPDQSSILFEVQNIMSSQKGGNGVSNTVTVIFHGKKWRKRT